MRALPISIVAATLMLCIAAKAGEPTEPVVTNSGTVVGEKSDGVAVFKGIPFAGPPIGDLRWKAPQAVKAWSESFSATKFSPACMQPGNVANSLPGAPDEELSEDCLYLNIWTPEPALAGKDEASGAGRAPVMVFIHGGAFSNGSGAIPTYWGDKLAKRGVVIVTINYRLGVFGFFAHPELTKEAGTNGSGNQGLLDQIEALKWVQRNIASFGGDPTKVTIWGQSAGSMFVSMLMASPLADGLFHRAIGESGGFFIPLDAAPPSTKGTWTLKGAEAQGADFARNLKAEALANLRALPADQLIAARGAGAFHPIIDGVVLEDQPYTIFRAGKHNDVPLLIGSNADEARPMITGKEIKLATFAEDIAADFGGGFSDVLGAYHATDDDKARDARAAFERDLRFGWDMWTWARLQWDAGDSRVFSYYFAHEPPYPTGSPIADWGAAHWAELRYVFDHLEQEPLTWTDEDRALANTMASYWTNFARSGDPNGEGLPQWPQYKSSDDAVLRIGSTIEAGKLANRPGLERFDRYFENLR